MGVVCGSLRICAIRLLRNRCPFGVSRCLGRVVAGYSLAFYGTPLCHGLEVLTVHARVGIGGGGLEIVNFRPEGVEVETGRGWGW